MLLYTTPGSSYGPILWLDTATLNLINSLPSAVVPITVSPTSKVPVTIEISRSLGIINLLTFSPSKNAYTLVVGFRPLAENSIFLDLIYGTRSVLITLGPSFWVEKVSLWILLLPVLCWVEDAFVPDLKCLVIVLYFVLVLWPAPSTQPPQWS